jgi:hypothetical protein
MRDYVLRRDLADAGDGRSLYPRYRVSYCTGSKYLVPSLYFLRLVVVESLPLDLKWVASTFLQIISSGISYCMMILLTGVEAKKIVRLRTRLLQRKIPTRHTFLFNGRPNIRARKSLQVVVT